MLVFLVMSSCKDNPNKQESCGLNLENVRENSFIQSEEAKDNLNELSLDMGYNGIKTGGINADYVQNEMFFDINSKNQIFWFVSTYYKTPIKNIPVSKWIYEVELKNLTAKNIYVDNSTFDHMSIVNIHSLNNNPNAFKLEIVVFENGNIKEIKCDSSSGMDLKMHPKKAKEFEVHLKNFLSSL